MQGVLSARVDNILSVLYCVYGELRPVSCEIWFKSPIEVQVFYDGSLYLSPQMAPAAPVSVPLNAVFDALTERAES